MEYKNYLKAANNERNSTATAPASGAKNILKHLIIIPVPASIMLFTIVSQFGVYTSSSESGNLKCFCFILNLIVVQL